MIAVFNDNALKPTQSHFVVVRLQLPFYAGQSTARSGFTQDYGTPVTSTGQDLQLKDYWFCCHNTPKDFGYASVSGDYIDLQNEAIHRCINGVSETRPILRPSQGLSTNAQATIIFTDFTGDPGPKAFTQNGTYFGKLKRRNILEDKLVTVYYFHVKSNGLYTWDDAKAVSYIAKSFTSNSNDNWQLKAAGLLSKIDFGVSQFPQARNSILLQDAAIDATSLFVDSLTDYSNAQVVAINEELMLVTGVTNNLLPNAELSIVRGPIEVSGKTFFSEVSDHNAGDSVQICYVADNSHCADIVRDMLFSAGVPDSYMPVQAWKNEIDQFVPEPNLTWIFASPEDVAEQVKRVLSSFTIDIFEDVEASEIQVSAGSAWQQPVATLRYGIEINAQSLRVTEQDNMRFSQAWVSYIKSKPLENDDLKNFSALAFAINADAQAEGLFEPKDKKLGPYGWLTKDPAELLTSKYVLRFGFMPERYVWNAEERFLNYKVGDVVILDGAGQDADGEPLQVGAQITQIAPKYNAQYRYYSVQALTYLPANTEGQVFIINGGTDVNLFNIAGAPPDAVNLIFLIDGNIGASSTASAGLTVGPFAPGSNITIIVRNGADIQGKGGNGGDGGDIILNQIDPPQGTIVLNAGDGEDGGIAFDASGQNVIIYLTGNVLGYDADGYLYAPGGGGAGGFAIIDQVNGIARAGHGGGGGAGRVIGSGGEAGTASGTAGSGVFPGLIGNDGTEICLGGSGRSTNGGLATSGSGGDCGEAGESQEFNGVEAVGGLAGKGIVLNGGNVSVITSDPARFINGNGDPLGKTGSIVTLDIATRVVNVYRYDDRELALFFVIPDQPAGPDLSGAYVDIATDGSAFYIHEKVVNNANIIWVYGLDGNFINVLTININNFDTFRGLIAFADGDLGISKQGGVVSNRAITFSKYNTDTANIEGIDVSGLTRDPSPTLVNSSISTSTWLYNQYLNTGNNIVFYDNNSGISGGVATPFLATHADVDAQNNLLTVQDNFRVYVHAGRTSVINETFDLPNFSKWAYTPVDFSPPDNRVLLENGVDFWITENNEFVTF